MQLLEKLWKCKGAQKHQTCNNRRKKKLFNVRNKLSYNKMVFRKFISDRNEYKKIKINKQVYLDLSILDISETAKI